MNRVRYEAKMLPTLTADQEESLKRLAMLSDDDIDLSDIPEITEWSGAVRRGLAPSDFAATTNLVSPTIIAKFKDKAKKTGGNYQDMINDALEEYLLDH